MYMVVKVYLLFGNSKGYSGFMNFLSYSVKLAQSVQLLSDAEILVCGVLTNALGNFCRVNLFGATPYIKRLHYSYSIYSISLYADIKLKLLL